MNHCYVFRKTVEHQDVIMAYLNQIKSNRRYKEEVHQEQISIADFFYIYPFLDGSIKNLEYLIIRNKVQQSGKMDIACNLASKEFYLHELSSKDFIFEQTNLEAFNIFNLEDIKKCDKEFITKILDKATTEICNRHHLVLTDKTNKMDISPIKDFEEFNKKYFLEQIYLIEYFSKDTKKPYQSIYSPLKNYFYHFEFEKSEIFEQYLKIYKKPIVYIPKRYLDYYYDISFETYLITIEELKYISFSQLYSKIRKNMQYKQYSKFEEYLNQLIFFFRKKQYLKEFIFKNNDREYNIFYHYLTLKYLPQSGYNLAQLVKEHLLDDSELRLLRISTNLGNVLAKKKLYEYYSAPKTYNAYFLKRYS